MLERLDKLISDYKVLPPGTTVLCAVSGGADSVCLLHRLYHLRPRLGIRLYAAHYNHLLRGAESERDEAFVRDFVRLCCGKDKWRESSGAVRELPAVELIVGRGDVAAQAARTGRGIEETARAMRYAFLEEAADSVAAGVIATAHNADDNAETVLLHLLRGSGLRGLSGMAPVRGRVVRPLLTTSRQEIEEYLRYYGMPHMEDSSNASQRYARNRIRHKVLPELEDICPGARVRIGQAAALLREDEEYLSGQAAVLADLARMKEDGKLTIPAEPIAQAPGPVAVRAVRMLIGRMTQGNDNCTAAHLRSVTALCASGNPSARTHLPGGLTASREYETLVFSRQAPPPSPQAAPMALPGTTEYGEYLLTCQAVIYQGQKQTADELYLSRSAVKAVTLRPRRTGDMLKRPGRGSKSVKKLFIDEKIPLNARDVLPVLESGGNVTGVALLGADAAFIPKEGQDCWHVSIRRKNCHS